MSVCWYCHWGWPRQTAEIYQAAAVQMGAAGKYYSALKYGPAHTVWSDENFEDCHILFCLDETRRALDWANPSKSTPEELRVILWSLQMLLAVPAEVRCCQPADYDGEHPENYPPPEGLEMVRV